MKNEPLPPAPPVVTVVIPTIGRPKYIGDTVRSVLSQDYPGLRVLISDNAPEIATGKVLATQGIADSRIRFVTRNVRMPFSDHMNACLTDADGEFVMILSDDDQLASGYVSQMVSLFAENPSVTVGLGPQTVVSETDLGVLSGGERPVASRVIDGAVFLRESLAGKLQTGVATYISLFARRDAILSIGGFKPYPDGSHADNFILWKLALTGSVALGTELMFYRVYATSHGLGTPFSALLQATRWFSGDCRAALEAAGVAPSERSLLLTSLKRNNVAMLKHRIWTVYRQRVSRRRLLGYAVRTAQFSLRLSE